MRRANWEAQETRDPIPHSTVISQTVECSVMFCHVACSTKDTDYH